MAAKTQPASAKTPTPIIHVNALRKIFREGTSKTPALDDVSFDIAAGEFCTIIGRSGSGKSTLLNMLAGLDKPSSGQIVILGHHIERMNENELVNFRLRHIGFVFQSYNLFPSYDALENVAMPLTYRGVSKQVRNMRAKKMIQAVGLTHRIHHTPSKMSGGEQQRVGIARALVSNPQIIFADEPTGNLDVKTSAIVLDQMLKIVKKLGTTLIVVTHDPEMSKYADHVIQLRDGVVVENRINPSPVALSVPVDSGPAPTPADESAAPRAPTATPRRRGPFGWLRRDKAQAANADAATVATKDTATVAATDTAVNAATNMATSTSTNTATDSATDAATDSATSAATDAAANTASDAAANTASVAAANTATIAATNTASIAAIETATSAGQADGIECGVSPSAPAQVADPESGAQADAAPPAPSPWERPAGDSAAQAAGNTPR